MNALLLHTESMGLNVIKCTSMSMHCQAITGSHQLLHPPHDPARIHTNTCCVPATCCCWLLLCAVCCSVLWQFVPVYQAIELHPSLFELSIVPPDVPFIRPNSYKLVFFVQREH